MAKAAQSLPESVEAVVAQHAVEVPALKQAVQAVKDDVQLQVTSLRTEMSGRLDKIDSALAMISRGRESWLREWWPVLFGVATFAALYFGERMNSTKMNVDRIDTWARAVEGDLKTQGRMIERLDEDARHMDEWRRDLKTLRSEFDQAIGREDGRREK